MIDGVLQDVDALRKRLLDLTLNNRLLNYRHYKGRSISIVDERPAEIYDFLVLNEKIMYFKPAAKNQPIPPEERETDEGEPVQIWTMPEGETEIPGKYTDRYLQTELTAETLQKTLFQTHKEAASVLQEQGYTVLFLALGFLEWYDENSPEKPRLAPLVLVPIGLERPSVGAQFRINWTGEDLLGNISLQARLCDSDIELPEFTIPEDKQGIDDYLQTIAECVKNKEGWRVLNSSVLGFFSFTKFVMYKDLDPALLPDTVSYSDNPIFRTVFEGSQPPAGNDVPPTYPRLDVVDADPSQIQVIDAAAEGQHVLVEGPPGTGKSQTILNVIARLLSEGKRVLFVSEKMAALEVVKKRLDAIGLGDFCLEVHSRYSSRKGVLKQLDATLHMDPPPVPAYEEHDEELATLTKDLDDYARELHRPFGKTELSPYRLVGEIEAAMRIFEENDQRIPLLQFNNPDEVTTERYRDAEEIIGELASLFDSVRPLKSNPWFGCNPPPMFEDERFELGNLLESYLNALEVLCKTAETARDYLKSDCELSLNSIRDLQHALEIIPLHESVGIEQLTETGWNDENKKASRLISQLEAYQRQREKVLKLFNESAMDHRASMQIHEVERYAGHWLRFFMPSYYAFRTTISEMFSGKPPHYGQMKADLGLLQACQETRAELNEIAESYGHMFGPYWTGEDSSPEALTAFMGWIIEIRQLVCCNCLSQASLEMVSASAGIGTCQSLHEDLSRALDTLNAIFSNIETRLKPDDLRVCGQAAGSAPISLLKEAVEGWVTHLDNLPKWSDFCQLVNRCRLSAAAPLLGILEMEETTGADLLPAFKGRFYGELLKKAIRIRQPLNDFNAEVHEKKIARFQRADQRANELNRLLLAVNLYERLPILTGSSPGSQAGILNAQLNRKRGHMPIRQLLRHCGPIIQRIKPCFMMSPLSIAQFLQPGEMPFDVVIFDEASQVRPEEAVGAFLRANQLIVMGDSKQLPPTSFFDRLTSGDEDEGDTATADMESLLTLCRGRLPEKPLQWHYRSRHHSLISVSNRESYDERLLVFPSPFESHEFLGLFFKHLPNARYDRGNTRMNRDEASEVVDAVFAHLMHSPDKSLGVATFSVSQRSAVEQEVERRLQESPDLEPLIKQHSSEPFFVKNLETVQGDERDVILISIGYGFDKADKLTLNFGPLNQEGGERRLNVLITRARERCVVFANFKGEDLHVSPDSSPRGICYLKTFLSYAEHRNFHGDTPAEPLRHNSLEHFVSMDLSALGNTVKAGVGCKRFSLDLALCDNETEDTYSAGIEFDGKHYASSKLARERDRLRPEILTGMGWHLERVWSIDWFKARKATAQHLQDAISSPPSRQQPPMGEIMFKDDHALRDNPLQAFVTDYVYCINLGIDTSVDLTSSKPQVLTRAVKQVVDVEGPIHRDEAIRRVRELWGLKQTGSRIKDALDFAINQAVEMKEVTLDGDFLRSLELRPLMLRKRSDIDWIMICDDEITVGIKAVLQKQYATPEDELIREVSYLFGLRRAGEESSTRIRNVVQALITSSALRLGYGDRLQLTHRPTTSGSVEIAAAAQVGGMME